MGCIFGAEEEKQLKPVKSISEAPNSNFANTNSGSDTPPENNENDKENINIDDNNNNMNDDNNTIISPKSTLMQVAGMIDMADTTIQEDEELEDIDIKDIDNENESSSDGADKFNKLMTMYEVTDDMKDNIDILIDKKVKELSNSTYTFLESAVHSKAGQKEGITKTNQDSYFVFNEFGPSNIMQLFGVCDGHGPSGHNVSQFVVEHLPKLLLSTKENILIALSKPAYSLIAAFEELEKKLYKDKEDGVIEFDISASGTTVSCGLRVGDYLYLANLGDSRAVMGELPAGGYGTDGDTLLMSPHKKVKVSSRQLTVDHDPKNKTEIDRINNTMSNTKSKLLIDSDGTSRIKVNLIDDKLGRPRQSVVELKQKYGVDALKQLNSVSASVSRSIGDKLAHKYGGVISKPDVIIHKLSKTDLFVMWASDGIWTVIDNDDVNRIIGNKLKNVYNEKKYDDLQKITDKFVKEARIVWTDEFDDYIDDITAVIARIGPTKLLND